jgi:hypothetical protein
MEEENSVSAFIDGYVGSFVRYMWAFLSPEQPYAADDGAVKYKDG